MTAPFARPDKLLRFVGDDVERILNAKSVLLGQANPPMANGVYIFSVADEITYVGEAKGRGGLRDRLLSKHLSGDNKHAAQRAFAAEYPDRQARRIHLRENLQVRWLEIADPLQVAVVERLLIWMLRPPWNLK